MEESVPADSHGSRLSFLYASITDMQAVIRATDSKVAAVLVILSIPFTKLDSIHAVTVKCLAASQIISLVLLVLFILSWATAFYGALMAIMSVNNPRLHINGAAGKGSFYCGDLFGPLKIIDSFENRSDFLSTRTWDQHRLSLPVTDIEIFNELSFEQMKLAYIRTMKLARCKTAYVAAVIWLTLGVIIWLFALSLGAA